MDVSTRLREARLRRGMSLDDVATSTKLSRLTLEHIDHGRFSQLPGGILTRGHLRAYASAVGLDPRQVVNQYVLQCFGDAGEDLPIVRPPSIEPDTHPGRVLLIGIVAMVFGLALYASFRGLAGPPATGASMSPALQQVRTDVPSSDPEPAILPDAAPGGADEQGVRIEIRSTGPCWVSATADGQLVVHRLMQTGERAVTTVREELVLRVGNPGAFAYWLNGAPGRPLGSGERPVTVRIVPGNYATFLDDSAPGTASPTKAI